MADNSGAYVTNRDVTVRTTTGHVIAFKKNEPKHVPASIRDEVQRIGAVPVDGEGDYSAAHVSEPKLRVPVGNDRVKKIKEAISEMILENDVAENFTATGLPKTDVITRKVGFTVDAKERSNIYKGMQKEGAFD